MIVARVWQAAIARASIPEDQRKDANLYVDECHNFLTLPGSVGDMLAEARGFRLGLVLAHQDLAQLPNDIAAAVSANARDEAVLQRRPRRRAGTVPPHQTRTGRTRPRPPRRLHRRGPAAGRQPGATRVHLRDQPAGATGG